MALETGQAAEISRCFSAADVDDYVALGGHRPVDGEVPEPLVNALFSYLLGVKLPGKGTNYLKQEAEFFASPRVGDTLTARVRISRLRPGSCNLGRLPTQATLLPRNPPWPHYDHRR